MLNIQENVEQYFQEGKTPEEAMKSYDEMLNRIKHAEINILQRKMKIGGKLPEIKKSISAIDYILEKRDEDKDQALETRFELSDTLYANATLPVTDKVCLWLGANVMVEYEINEAKDLLLGKQAIAEKSIKQLDADAYYLREQITTLEVSKCNFIFLY
ncbi:Prefoldin-domain-containing protein [Rozella allomycis CSF55]|uniref:Prefoldin subunit 3 n=1 Tax=Rozella allomycis (strain CSF55) TaxID=988480 RepID=A0A075AT93_ROZAC|nr:Prefoldin subunit domain-containing protein [Rozella allomycis CSF55]RKP22161.1 Prefoldin-domain-containing protein [Rozella allomycis CSF55]|eukprot:EPZ31738.1 Prefoldin subunit domain-containing protein [Rozella allomycis CSF55]